MTGFKLNKNYKKPHNYYPKTSFELINVVDDLIKERGKNANLNDIDTSKITNMSYLFYHSDFDGDISRWDVSNVDNMSFMFCRSKFTGKNGDLSKWDISNVKDMGGMFYHGNFNGDILKWDIKSDCDTRNMF